jgi:hypothetical protein
LFAEVSVLVHTETVKKIETFPQWAKDQHAHQKRTISALRKFVKKVAPKLTESVKWGNGVWLGEEWPVLFLHAKGDHLQFGFFAGAFLKDPEKLLKGTGKHVKHLKVYTLKDIDEVAFSKLIRQAVRAERED